MACLKYLQKAWSTTISKGGHDSNVLSSLRLIEAKPNYLKGIITIDQKHLNNHGLTDTVTSLSLLTLGYNLPTGLSVNISTEFVNPGGKLKDNLICISKIIKSGHNLSYLRCEFYSTLKNNQNQNQNQIQNELELELGKLVAYGSQTKFMKGFLKSTSFSEDGKIELGLNFEGNKESKL
uniref:Uncharacterized protein n=1 Tax=Kwoniella pini CBS 10737 TaxID=1296096 RepID=A0A1B9HS93_9TREE|nr:uncharacterized protein I206_07916 [Kwoniella pini CBS 10737]OCF46131.1 hypothetical protein I206_07916 [Kwoniella pini CBS 10737]